MTTEGHRQSDEHWNYFKEDDGATSEKRDGAYLSFSERTQYHLELNSAELNSELITIFGKVRIRLQHLKQNHTKASEA